MDRHTTIPLNILNRAHETPFERYTTSVLIIITILLICMWLAVRTAIRRAQHYDHQYMAYKNIIVDRNQTHQSIIYANQSTSNKINANKMRRLV